jgi:hypothetical protein
MIWCLISRPHQPHWTLHVRTPGDDIILKICYLHMNICIHRSNPSRQTGRQTRPSTTTINHMKINGHFIITCENTQSEDHPSTAYSSTAHRFLNRKRLSSKKKTCKGSRPPFALKESSAHLLHATPHGQEELRPFSAALADFLGDRGPCMVCIAACMYMFCMYTFCSIQRWYYRYFAFCFCRAEGKALRVRRWLCGGERKVV